MIADLHCTKCGHEEERFWQSIQPNCTRCGGITEKKMSADWSFTFKSGHGKGTSGGDTWRAPSSYKNIQRG